MIKIPHAIISHIKANEKHFKIQTVIIRFIYFGLFQSIMEAASGIAMVLYCVYYIIAKFEERIIILYLSVDYRFKLITVIHHVIIAFF